MVMNAKNNVPEELIQHESGEHAVRLEKVATLQTMGVNPWPEYKPVSATMQQAIAEYTHSNDSTKRYALSGRIMTKRDHGKTFFCTIQDRSAHIQIYLKKDTLGAEVFESFKSLYDTGDIIWVEGTLFTTKKGEITLDVAAIALTSKCLHPLPEKFHGLTHIEQRYRQRHLDLMTNHESREKFKKRSLIIQSIRSFLLGNDFIEVETPMLHTIPGGAAARPFITHHNAYNMDLYLRIAPELFLKRLVVGGFERVFEINRNFRNEGISTRHNPEFTMLEFYMAHGDYNTGMQLVEQLISTAVQNNFGTTHITYQDKQVNLTAPFKRMTVEESLIQIGGLSAHDITPTAIDATIERHGVQLAGKPGYGMKLFALFEALVEGKIVDPTFITGYPLEVSPLAKKDPHNPELTARAELFIVGMEFANLFTELNDPIDQAARFKQQAQAREAGDHEAHFYDADFVHALEYGLPPTVGVGIGIDRLVMLLTNTGSIKDVILFPTLKIAKQHTATHKEEAAQLSIDPIIFEQFPGTALGVLVGFNLENSDEENPQISALLRRQEELIRAQFATHSVDEHPNILVWRDAYQKFGADPKKYRSSIENLVTRIIGGHSVRHVNTLVDLYNLISLKYLLPSGGEDIDHLNGNTHLTVAHANEVAVLAFGEKEAKSPEPGEVIYKDQGGTLCRRWNWRGTERSKLTAKTKNAFFIFESLPPVNSELADKAIHELAELIRQYCGGSTKLAIINKKNPQVSLKQHSN